MSSFSRSSHTKAHPKWVRYLTIALLLSFALFATVGSLWAQENPTAESMIQTAWNRAVTSGVFDFRTQVEQVTYPAPSVSNAGRPLQESELGMEGQFNKFDETFAMTLWQDASFDPVKGIEVKVEDGKTYGRTGLSDWEEIGNVADSFAPGGVLLAF